MRHLLSSSKTQFLATLIALLAAGDQWAKAAVRQAMSPGESIAVLGDWFRLTYVRNNRGFSWWVPALPAWAGIALQLLLVAILLLALPVYLFYTEKRRQSIWADTAFIALSAACLGHLTDNLFVPFTTDFLRVWHSPSANFADLYAYVGLVALVIEILALRRMRPWRGWRDFFAQCANTRHEFLAFLRSAIRRE